MRLALVLALAAGCAATPPEAPTPVLPAPAAPVLAAGDTLLTGRLGLGETLRVGTASVRFDGVAEDSRCPQGVTCVWEGRARVRLLVGADAVVFTVGSADATAPLRVGDQTLDVTALDPFPGSPEAGATPSVAYVVRQG